MYVYIYIGVVVVANLIYQVEGIGQNCSTWNNTGPGCNDTAASTDTTSPYIGSPDVCTSIIAQTPDGSVYHGRNLDWDLPVVLRKNMVNINYQRNNKTVFTGTQIVPFVGILSGIMPGGFTYSMDARNRGGNVLLNVLEMLAQGGGTPAQHARRVFENADNFTHAVTLFDSGDLVNDVYYIVGGTKRNEGVVVTRNRQPPNDLWWIENTTSTASPAGVKTTGGDNESPERLMDNTDETSKEGWFILETNYDHWKPVPDADNRRDPGMKLMNDLGSLNVNETSLMKVMKTWPIFNHHTDMTGVFSAGTGLYTTMWWDDDEEEA